MKLLEALRSCFITRENEGVPRSLPLDAPLSLDSGTTKSLSRGPAPSFNPPCRVIALVRIMFDHLCGPIDACPPRSQAQFTLPAQRRQPLFQMSPSRKFAESIILIPHLISEILKRPGRLAPPTPGASTRRDGPCGGEPASPVSCATPRKLVWTCPLNQEQKKAAARYIA